MWITAGVLAIGLGAVSSAAIFIRLAMEVAKNPDDPTPLSLALAALRLAIAAVILLPAWRGFQFTNYSFATLKYAVLAGVCLAVHFVTWTTSLAYTSIAASTVLVTTSPIWVVLLSWLWLKEKPKILTLVGITVALAGGLLVGLSGIAGATPGSHPALGNGLALVGSWAVSLYLLWGRAAQQRGLPLRHYTVLVYTTAALVLLPLPFWFGLGYGGYPSIFYGYVGLMAVFPQLIGHTSFNWAVGRISPTLITVVILGEPIVASFLGYWIFGEVPGKSVLWGTLILLVGVVLVAWDSRPEPSQPGNLS